MSDLTNLPTRPVAASDFTGSLERLWLADQSYAGVVYVCMCVCVCTMMYGARMIAMCLPFGSNAQHCNEPWHHQVLPLNGSTERTHTLSLTHSHSLTHTVSKSVIT